MYKGLMPSYKKQRDQPLIYLQRIQIQGEKRQDAQLHLFEKIYGSAGSSLLHMSFLQLQQVGATLHYSAQASHCGAFSCGFSLQSTQAQLSHDMWDLPRPGRKSMSPAMAGGFLTTGPPGKSLAIYSYLLCSGLDAIEELILHIAQTSL